jgi:hypothetical protein
MLHSHCELTKVLAGHPHLSKLLNTVSNLKFELQQYVSIDRYSKFNLIKQNLTLTIHYSENIKLLRTNRFKRLKIDLMY